MGLGRNLIKKLLAIIALTSLTGCLPEAPVLPIKIAMNVIPENETLLIAEQLNYFPRSDVHIVEAPDSVDLMPILRSGAVDGVVISLESVLDWSAKGLDLTIVAVVNGTNKHSFPQKQNIDSNRRIDRESYNVIAIESNYLAKHSARVAQLVTGWQRVIRKAQSGSSFEELPNNYTLPQGRYNFTSYNGNKKLLIIPSAVSLHAVIRARVQDEANTPKIDGQFFMKFAKDAEKDL